MRSAWKRKRRRSTAPTDFQKFDVAKGRFGRCSGSAFCWVVSDIQRVPEETGTGMETAVRVFLKQVVVDGRFPFEPTAEAAEDAVND